MSFLCIRKYCCYKSIHLLAPRASTHIHVLTTSADIHYTRTSCASFLLRLDYVNSVTADSTASLTCIHAFISTRLDHCCSLYAGIPIWQSRSLDRVLLSAARLFFSHRQQIGRCLPLIHHGQNSLSSLHIFVH